jgi:DNA-binding transcriptional ArsR family regulator
VALIEAAELVESVVGAAPPAVEFGRYSTAMTLLVDALGTGMSGAPQAWRRAAVSRLDARDVAAFEPVATSAPDEPPSCLCVLTHRTRTGFAPLDEDLDRIAGMPPEQLLAQLPAGRAWDHVARDPKRWLHRFARAVGRACAGLEDQWRRAAAMLEREADRIGDAVARGAGRELLAVRLPESVAVLEAEPPHGAERDERLALVPMLGGPGSSHAWLMEGEVTHIAYPIRDGWRLLEDSPPPPAELEALIGEQRATILRALDRPATAGRLAERLLAVPSAASHHLAILEKAGLVLRERQGRSVLVHRTARGTDLLALY